MLKKVFPYIGIFVVSLFVMLPMFVEPYHIGDDTMYHVTNVMAIEEQILDGNIPTNVILDKIGYSLGYATRLFYPPLSHTITAYIGAIFSFINLNIIDTFKIVHFLVLFLSGISMYKLSYQLSKNKVIAFFSSVIYMTFPYHISDIYARDSLAECFLFIFLPIIFSSVCYLLDGNVKKFFPLFIFGYVGGILSHFTMMIYFTLFLGSFLLVSRKKVFNKEFLVPFIVATICVIGITSFFTFGMIENYLFSNYVVFEKGEMYKRIYKTALVPFEYINITPWFHGEIKHYFSLVVIIMLIITYRNREKLKFSVYTRNFMAFLILSFLLSTKLFPWNYVPSFLKMVQFPWRFQVFVGLILSIYAPICLFNFNKKKWLLSFVLLLIISSYFAIDFSKDVLNLTDINWNRGMGWQKEYLPISAKVNKKYISNKNGRIDFVSGSGTYSITLDKVPNLNFSINVDSTSSVELPRIYYPGYELVDSNGNKYDIYESSNGLLQVDLYSGGEFSLMYTGSVVNRISKIISLVSLVCTFLIYIFCVKIKISKMFINT